MKNCYIEIQGAKSSNSSPRSDPRENAEGQEMNVPPDLVFPTFEMCPDAPEAVRKQRWLTPTHLKQLQIPKSIMPTELFDFLQPMLVHHLADTKRTNMYVANYDVMTNALKAGLVMTKKDLFQAIRRHYDFIDAQVIVFALNEDEFSGNPDGHLIVVAVDFSCDTVYTYDSYNRQNGVRTIFERVKDLFIAPYLSYLVQDDGPLDIPQTGMVSMDSTCIQRAQAFRLKAVKMPMVQADEYSCGFWAVEILLQIVLDQVSLKDGVRVTFEVEEYRKYLSQLIQTRYLGIDGTLRRQKIVAQQTSAIVLNEVKNDGFAKPSGLTNKLTMSTLAGLPTKVKISGPCSVGASVASQNKTMSGAFKKHCEQCEFRLISNWSQHKKDKHGGTDVPSIKCIGEQCSFCFSGTSQMRIGGNGKHKMAKCSSCNHLREARTIDYVTKLCKMCTFKIKKGFQAGFEKSISNGGDYNGEDESREVDLYIGTSHIGGKRTYQQAAMRFEAPQEDDLGDYLNNSTENASIEMINICTLKGKQPTGGQQRLKQAVPTLTGEYLTHADTPMHEVDIIAQQSSVTKGQKVIVKGLAVHVFHTSASVLEVLRDIEAGEVNSIELALKLHEVSHMLTQPTVLLYLNRDRLVKLRALISDLLQNPIQLTHEDRTGLLVASFVLGGTCWSAAVKMLSTIQQSDREELINSFADHALAMYNGGIVKWILTNWKVITDQHLQLFKHLKQYAPLEIIPVLDLSIAVNFKDINRFVEVAKRFITCPAARSVLVCLNTKSVAQQLISFDAMLALIQCVRAESNQKTISACQDQLVQTPLAEWIEFIQQNKCKFNVMNARSIQAFINELSGAYGQGDAKLSQDLTSSGGKLFGLLISQTRNAGPNNRQFAMAQYCIGQLTKRQRQLWSVPGGQGKSRIGATIAAIALMTGIVVNIYIVHQTEQLMKRDQQTFQIYWTLLGCEQDAVGYQVGLDFEPKANSLIVFDEADRFILHDTEKFASLINNCFCICLTATPDDGDSKGPQRVVVDTLQFSRYNYVTDSPKFQKIKLEVDEVVVAVQT